MVEDIKDTSSLELEQKVVALFRKNLVQGTTKSVPIQEYAYICPDINRYSHQWLWDSCFHIIVNCHLDIEFAKKELETLLKRQWKNGFLPHMNYWELKSSIVDKKVQKYYKDEKTSSLTQTPVVAQALKAIYLKTSDKDYLSEQLPKVRNYYDNLYDLRVFQDDEVPLLNIIHSWESGIDNCPIYDKALQIKGKMLAVKWGLSLLKQLKVLKKCNWDMRKIREEDFFLYKDLLFNCVYIQGLRKLSFLFKELEQNKESERFDKRAKDLEKILINNFWNPEEGLFLNRFGRENHWDTVKSSSSLIPLILDGLPLNIATTLVEEHLLNEEEFWTEFPVPSVAINEPSYSEKGLLLWRGPTWINTNWFLIEGLKKHGFKNVAIELAQKTINLVEYEGFREYYNPKTGKGMGAKNFGWSALVVDIEKSIFNTDLDFILLADYRHIKKGGKNPNY